MSDGVYVPSALGEGYFSDWQAPAAGLTDDAKVWAFNATTRAWKPVSLAYEPAGAVAAHVALGDPHGQYLLVSAVSAYGATLIDDANASAARTTLGLGTIATEAESGYLLASGARAGATAGAQSFTQGVVTGVIRPAADSTTAVQVQTAAGTNIVNIDSTNRRVGIGTNAPSTALQVVGVARFGASTSSWFQIQQTNTDQYGWLCNPGGVYFIKFNTGPGTGRDGNISFGAAGNSPSSWVDIQGSQTNGASLRIRPGAFPTGSNRNDGDIGYVSSGRLKFYRGSTEEVFATGVTATGGAATAGMVYGTTEQTMLQKIYDAARSFGLLD